MSFEVYLHPKANDFLNSADSSVRERIKVHLRELTKNPNKKGKPYIPPLRIMRIGVYRAIYEILWSESKVNVHYIDHRDMVYENFERIFT